MIDSALDSNEESPLEKKWQEVCEWASQQPKSRNKEEQMHLGKEMLQKLLGTDSNFIKKLDDEFPDK